MPESSSTRRDRFKLGVSRRSLLILSASLICAGGARAAPAATPKPSQPPTAVKIGVINGLFENSYILAGIRQGIYRDHGVDLEIVNFQSGNLMTRAVLTNELTTGVMGISQIFPANQGGADLKLVAAPMAKPNIVLLAQKNIGSLEDLYGKDIGTNGLGGQLHTLMVALYLAKGLDPSKLVIANVGPTPEVTRAVVAGRVAAGPVQLGDWEAVKKESNVKVLVDLSEALPQFLRLAMPVRQMAIDTQDDLLRRLFMAHSQAYRWGLANRDAVVKVAVDQMQYDQRVAQLNYDIFKSRSLVQPDFTITPEQISFMQQLNVHIGSQQQILPFERVVDLRYIQAVEKELGPYKR